MTPHFIIFGLLSLFAFTNVFNVKRDQKIVLSLFSYIVLVLFAGLRYFPDQADYSEYYKTFNEIAAYGLSFDSTFEPGYMLLMWVVSWFTSQAGVFFVVLAAIGVGLNYVGIKRYMPKYFFLAVLFYFVHTFLMREMGAVRAGLAAGICFLTLRTVEEKKPWKFVFGTLLAMCFHLSAIVFFLVYPIFRLNWRVKTMWIVLVSSFVVGMVMPLGKVLTAMPFVGGISRLAGYAEDAGAALGILTNPTTLKQLFFACAGLLCYNRIIEKVPHYRIILVPYLISVCWLMLWNDFPIVAGRFAMFFSITEVLLVPCFIYIFEKMSQPIAISILVVLAFAILYLNGITFLTPESGYYPYRIILSQ